MRAQGYNLIRWRLSPELNADLDGDFAYTPEVQDKYDYFLYACAREGVYSHIMLASHLFGEKNVLWGDRFDVKVRFLLGDKTVRGNWKKSSIRTRAKSGGTPPPLQPSNASTSSI